MIALSLLVLLSGFQSKGDGNIARRSQYRGPFEDVLASVPLPGTGGTPAGELPGGALLDPVGYLEGYNRWEFWFEIHKDLLLRSRDFRRHELLTPLPPGTPPIEDGRVRSEDARTQIAAGLRAALKSTDERVVREAVMALGRIGARESLPDLDDLSAKGDAETRRVAAIAMGMLDDRTVLTKLVNLLIGETVPTEVRAAAALGLGLHGRREGARFLRDYLDKNFHPDTALGADKDVFIAAIASLGMCRERDAAPLFLERYKALRDARLGRTRAIETQLISALGRCGDSSALIALLEALEEKDLDLRRAAALALGDLGDRAAVKPLVKTLAEDNDEQTRGFAAISLGRLGGDGARDALREAFAVKGSRTVKSFAALGLGLLGDRASAPELMKGLALRSEDNMRGSFAIALGLLRETKACDQLWKIVETRGAQEDFRGYCAIAIGMIRPEGAVERMLKIAEEDPDKVDLWRRGLALGLGLLGDPRVGPALTKMIQTDTRDVVREHAALGLNLCRARTEFAPLLARLEKEPRGDVAIFCISALAGLGDRHEYPIVSEAFFNVNYRIRNSFLEDLWTIL